MLTLVGGPRAILGFLAAPHVRGERGLVEGAAGCAKAPPELASALGGGVERLARITGLAAPLRGLGTRPSAAFSGVPGAHVGSTHLVHRRHGRWLPGHGATRTNVPFKLNVVRSGTAMSARPGSRFVCGRPLVDSTPAVHARGRRLPRPV